MKLDSHPVHVDKNRSTIDPLRLNQRKDLNFLQQQEIKIGPHIVTSYSTEIGFNHSKERDSL